MHPALSMIAFTVLAGAGFGLIILTALLDLLGAGLVPTPFETVTLGVVGIVLASLGLLASTLHLANPKNAWRAVFRFRSSWLSREAVFSLVFFPVAFVWLGGTWFPSSLPAWLVTIAAALSLILAIATIFSTGMIYASLRTIPQWHSPLVPTNYLLLGLASGSVVLTTVLAFTRPQGANAAALTLALLLLAATAKLIYYYWIGKPSGSSINTAVGLTRGQVRLLESGQSSKTFLDKEFRYQASANRLLLLRFLVTIAGFLLPILLIGGMLQTSAAVFAVLAILLMFPALAVERWLFFAEARHVVNLFYGSQRV